MTGNSTSAAHRTPLFDVHKRLGAKMTEYAGWLMPVSYSGIVTEHMYVREAAGIFDISHMGEILVSGQKATEFLQRMCTADLSGLREGQAKYSLLCKDNGGIIDDVICYRTGTGFCLVVNASRRSVDVNWLQDNLAVGVHLEDVSEQTAAVAVQGPESQQVLEARLGLDLDDLGYYCHRQISVRGCEVMISRTGYTGEDGFEIFMPAEQAERVWTTITGDNGAEARALPVGLGARDTLRLEAGYRLYGNDITEDITPIAAGLKWAVSFDKGEFAGRSALQAELESGPENRLIPFVVMDRGGVPRPGCPVYDGDQNVGEVTSGTHSPVLRKGIGFARVKAGVAEAGRTLTIQIRRRGVTAQVWKGPFVRINTR